MADWFAELPSTLGLTWNGVVWGLLLFVVTFVGSLVLVGIVAVRLPADYFTDSRMRAEARRRKSWFVVIGKNALGVALVVGGILLSLPAMPGQGIVTILFGLAFLDFPGKRRVLQWILSRRRILDSINRLRSRFGKAPMVAG